MTSYLLVLHDGSKVEAIKNGGHFTADNGQIYNLMDARSFVSFDHITHDQLEFEALFRSFTLKGDYSKFDSLMYRNTLTEASYKVWRIAKGYSIDDPEYKIIERAEATMPMSSVYPANRGGWVGD